MLKLSSTCHFFQLPKIGNCLCPALSKHDKSSCFHGRSTCFQPDCSATNECLSLVAGAGNLSLANSAIAPKQMLTLLLSLESFPSEGAARSVPNSWLFAVGCNKDSHLMSDAHHCSLHHFAMSTSQTLAFEPQRDSCFLVNHVSNQSCTSLHQTC